MRGEMPWREAIIKVLRDTGRAMHYTEIADEIIKQGLRRTVGATPPYTVNAMLTTDIKDAGEGSTFVRVARGEYVLRELLAVSVQQAPLTAEGQANTDLDEVSGIIQAFGMFWRRDSVVWKQAPTVLGQQQPGATPVDFGPQKAVYLLYDRRDVVYAGRAFDLPLGVRLFQHTYDRLNGRWDRFSWFGFLPVSDVGKVRDVPESRAFSLDELISTVEALFIEALEPPQNRKRGDDLRAVEYLQAEDPALRAAQNRRFLDEIRERL